MACVSSVEIQYNLNIGEKSLPDTSYKLDGYCEETNTTYEFHGCPECFSDNREDTYHPLTKQSLKELYALTLKKKAYIKQLGMNYVCIWDHEFQKIKNQNPELKQFITNRFHRETGSKREFLRGTHHCESALLQNFRT